MIAFIQGELCDAGQDTIVVACHGIGYEIQIPVSVAQVLPDPGNVVKIYTYTYVREDALGLFGFLTQAADHCQWCRTESGIGNFVSDDS